MITIKCRGIKKFYGRDQKTAALRGVNLDISDNQLTLLVGPSGSGKTTLMSIIHTILTPDEGDVFVLGQHINKMSELEKAYFRNQRIGVVFQNLYLIPTLTVLENVILPLIIRGENERHAKKKGLSHLEQLEIAHKHDSCVQHLSKGEQHRVAIARALINDPEILMCDEPTSALDQEHGHAFMSLLREFVLSKSRTVFVITHDQRIFSFADQIIKINDGVIEEQHA